MYRVVEKLKGFFKPKTVDENESNTNDDVIGEQDAFNDQEEEEEQRNVNQHQIKLNTPVNTTGLLNKVRKKMYITFCDYYSDPAPQELMSALLDPRLKSLDFISATSRLEVESILRELYNKEKTLEERQKERERYGLKNSKII